MEGRDGKGGHEPRTRIYRDQLLTVAEFEDFRNQLIQEIKSILKENSEGTTKKWLKSSEVKKLLGISTGTLQNLRQNGSLAFNKVGGIIFYDYNQIVKLIERNEQH